MDVLYMEKNSIKIAQFFQWLLLFAKFKLIKDESAHPSKWVLSLHFDEIKGE